MTVFDVLMPVAQRAYQTGRGTAQGSAAGDWRQAVEHAQARSWLADRNTENGQGPQPDPGQPPASEKESGSAVRTQPRPAQDIHAQQAREPARQEAAAIRGSGGEASTPWQIPSLVQGPIGTPTLAVAPIASSRLPMTHSSSQAAVLTQVASIAGVRPRKQSLHVETGEQGVSVWVRDTAMNSQQANHLATAIAASLGGGSQRLAALYLNGRPLADDQSSSSLSLSSTTLSE